MLQLAWLINDEQGSVLERGNVYVLAPPDCCISAEATAIHGITQEEIQKMPATLRKNHKEALETFFNSMKTHRVERMVAHNLSFDFHILINELQRTFTPDELQRNGFKDLWMEMKAYCTYRKGIQRLREQRSPRNPRSPKNTPRISGKLTSFYSHFVEPWETSALAADANTRLHRADTDVELTWRLFQRLWEPLEETKEVCGK